MPNQKLSTPLIVFLITISIVAHRVVYEYMKHQQFNIQKIVVSGAFLSRDMKFEQIISSSTNLAQGNLSKLDIQGLKQNLEKIELIKNAEVKRDLPYTLTIDITERKPVAILKTGKTNYTIDSEGVILSLTPNITLPTVAIDFGIAINKNSVADEFLVQMLNALASKSSTNIQSMHIDKNRKTSFSLYEVKPEFYIERMILNDNYIDKAIKIGNSLTNTDIKLPKTIDIYSYEDTSIGFY